MKRLALALPLLLAGCATQVYHPTKSEAEMQADVKLCTAEANRAYWMDPIAALYNAYDCLEAKGYQRPQKGLATDVERAFGEAPPPAKGQALPCPVPCKPK